MAPELEQLALEGHLYTSVILHGGSVDARLHRALGLARTLLCDAADRGLEGCECRHCARIQAPSDEDSRFHPDAHILWQDLKTVTSVEATRKLLRAAHLRPFEARGQVFIVPTAETLSDEAANVLLKILEEPPLSAPRHFFLLCPAAERLLPTIRSRSMSVYMGPVQAPDVELLSSVAAELGDRIRAFGDTGSVAYMLAVADALLAGSSWDDPRDSRPWTLAASAVLEVYRGLAADSELRPSLLALAEDLLLAPEMSLRRIQSRRIVEGLVARRLGAT